MKTLTRLPHLAAILAAIALPVVVSAADSPADVPAHPHAGGWLAQHPAMARRIAKKLGLSADQITQLRASRANAVAAVKAIRADATLTPDQRRAKVRETVQAAHTAMRGVLTPDQQAKLREMRTRWRAGA